MFIIWRQPSPKGSGGLAVVLLLLVGAVRPDPRNSDAIQVLKENNEIAMSNTTTEKLMPARNRSFSIDYEGNTFQMDGQPFRYVAGSLHYFRSPHEYWRDRLRTLRAAGLNVVSTYVEWSFHEPERGQYQWTGDKDLVKFIEIAQEENLYVILRPGPYICAERDMGGFPYWLLTYYPQIKLRTNDEDYKREVTKWYAELMSKMKPLLYENGGPIIMVQVENEYGSFPACDADYMSWLAMLTQSWVQGAALLFTTDGPSNNMLRCGSTPGAYATVDFGIGQNVDLAWLAMRLYSKKGPLVNSEFYPGWLSHWGEDVSRVASAKVVKTLETMLKDEANVNFYMFHGGTNFDYTAGSNLGTMYTPDLTSYDYDAPMTEAGDPTPKYSAIREALLNYMPMPPYDPPAVRPKGSLGPVALRPALALLGPEGRLRLGRAPSRWASPPTLEALHQRAGLTLYEAELPARRPDPAVLAVPGLKDRALVYLDGFFIGALSRTRKLYTLSILADQGNFLQILVENQGRINYGPVVNDFKGIQGDVTLGSVVIKNWQVTSFPLETIDKELEMHINGTENSITRNPLEGYKSRATPFEGFLSKGPVVYTAKFQLNEGEALDTYLDVTGWGKEKKSCILGMVLDEHGYSLDNRSISKYKTGSVATYSYQGFAWVNDRHLGRYWPSEGPQITLYTPGVYLNKYPEENTIVLLEMQNAPPNPSIRFLDHHIGV